MCIRDRCKSEGFVLTNSTNWSTISAVGAPLSLTAYLLYSMPALLTTEDSLLTKSTVTSLKGMPVFL